MRASDRAYRTLLEEIQHGVLAPGAVLAEVEQAARLGVSRTPLREAMGRLVADGLVVQQSPRVTVVSALDADEIKRLFEVRHGLEATAARLAATRGDSRVFAEIAGRLRPIEVAQAARLGVSRTPLREAMGRLVADGLVVQQSPRVSVVSALDADEIKRLFEVRHGLEATAARLAATRGDSRVFAELAGRFR